MVAIAGATIAELIIVVVAVVVVLRLGAQQRTHGAPHPPRLDRAPG